MTNGRLPVKDPILEVRTVLMPIEVLTLPYFALAVGIDLGLPEATEVFESNFFRKVDLEAPNRKESQIPRCIFFELSSPSKESPRAECLSQAPAKKNL